MAAISPETPACPPVRTIAIAAKVDGHVVGLGGVASFPNGIHVAFTDISDEARKYPVSIHRAGLRAVALAKKHGIKRLQASGVSHPASERWLLRLGFRRVETDGAPIYVADIGQDP
jgi:N-acetylglutamate synthase-like GNAT family acetyltransferase